MVVLRVGLFTAVLPKVAGIVRVPLVGRIRLLSLLPGILQSMMITAHIVSGKKL